MPNSHYDGSCQLVEGPAAKHLGITLEKIAAYTNSYLSQVLKDDPE